MKTADMTAGAVYRTKLGPLYQWTGRKDGRHLIMRPVGGPTSPEPGVVAGYTWHVNPARIDCEIGRTIDAARERIVADALVVQRDRATRDRLRDHLAAHGLGTDWLRPGRYRELERVLDALDLAATVPDLIATRDALEAVVGTVPSLIAAGDRLDAVGRQLRDGANDELWRESVNASHVWTNAVIAARCMIASAAPRLPAEPPTAEPGYPDAVVVDDPCKPWTAPRTPPTATEPVEAAR